MKIFQVLSRNNDVNGNPYRLLLVFNDKAQLVQAYEARSSSPNIEDELRKSLPQLRSFHLSATEYNTAKAWAKRQVMLTAVD